MAMSVKEAYRMDVEAELNQYEMQLEELKKNAAKGKAEPGWEELVNRIESAMGDARIESQHLKDVTEDTWKSAQDGINHVRDELRALFERAGHTVHEQ